MKKHRFSDAELLVMERSCIPFAICQLVDNRVVVLVVSDGLCELFGLDRKEAESLMDRDRSKNTHPDDVARISEAILRFVFHDEPYDVVYRIRIDGKYRIIHAHGKHTLTNTGDRIATIWYTDEGPYLSSTGEGEYKLNESLSRALHEESLYQQSNYDHLTGLPRMTYFFELAEDGRIRLLAEGKSPALLFFNLSGMKFFNKKHGFAEGDKLIYSVARVLASHFGLECCSRLGQDHFAVYTDVAGVEDKLRRIFAECRDINDGKSLPIHVGIYLNSTQTIDVGTACDRAKYACNLNPEAFVSSYRYFDSKMLAQTELQQYIVDHLDQAIKEGWIQVYYQAIVRAANSRVSDEEALARWVDPELGLLSPADFIPILESAKLIYKLDLHVLDQVLQKMKRQADAELYVVPQSINLSRTDFDQEGFVDEVCRRVDAMGIDRGKLTIEITESVVGSDFIFMKEQIERFCNMGFKVWMDDFGSGYSSLDVLQNIRFNLIKLDMRFLQRFEKGGESKIILTELVRMAMGLGIDTVAEGVETQEQVDFLREIGCSKLQGYYFTKPVPMDTIIERKRKGTLIGFENPDEADYYATIGRINLYDSAAIRNKDYRTYRRYFDAIPMAILESDGQQLHVARSNTTYREYMERVFGVIIEGHDVRLPEREGRAVSLFIDAVFQCGKDGKPAALDEETGKGEVSHALINRVAVNPVTGTAAILVAVFAVIHQA
ncbi:MAG: EAL domain-containing protein [Coriobacteriales bacterium]|nr:EAL domain-containing protein [Coriobacteriales bacterium]